MKQMSKTSFMSRVAPNTVIPLSTGGRSNAETKPENSGSAAVNPKSQSREASRNFISCRQLCAVGLGLLAITYIDDKAKNQDSQMSNLRKAAANPVTADNKMVKPDTCNNPKAMINAIRLFPDEVTGPQTCKVNKFKNIQTPDGLDLTLFL